MQSLNANRMQKIAQEAVITQILKESTTKVFGRSVCIDNDLVNVSRAINENIDLQKRRGIDTNIEIKPSVLMMLKNHQSIEVRKLIVQLLPESYLRSFIDDMSDVVRYYVAKRIDLKNLKEMQFKYPRDLLLNEICNKRLDEVEIKKVDKTVKTKNINDIELSDTWYKTQARNILQDYGEFSYGTPRCVERHYNPLAVKRYCLSTKLTSGVTIDEEKLQKAVDDLLKEIDEQRANPAIVQLRTIKENLRLKLNDININVMPIIEEQRDVIDDVYDVRYDTRKFVRSFEKNFIIKQIKYVPNIHQLKENIELFDFNVPSVAKFSCSVILEKVEKIVTTYVNKWNMINEDKNLVLSWNYDQNDDQIIFDVEKK